MGKARKILIAGLLSCVVALCPFSRAHAEWGTSDSQLLSDLYITVSSMVTGVLSSTYYDVDAIMYQLTTDYTDGSTSVRGYLAQIANSVGHDYSAALTAIQTSLNNIYTAATNIGTKIDTGNSSLSSINTATGAINTAVGTISTKVDSLAKDATLRLGTNIYASQVPIDPSNNSNYNPTITRIAAGIWNLLYSRNDYAKDSRFLLGSNTYASSVPINPSDSSNINASVARMLGGMWRLLYEYRDIWSKDASLKLSGNRYPSNIDINPSASSNLNAPTVNILSAMWNILYTFRNTWAQNSNFTVSGLYPGNYSVDPLSSSNYGFNIIKSQAAIWNMLYGIYNGNKTIKVTGGSSSTVDLTTIQNSLANILSTCNSILQNMGNSSGGTATDLTNIENMLSNLSFRTVGGQSLLRVSDQDILAEMVTLEGLIDDIQQSLETLNQKSNVPDNDVIGNIDWEEYENESDFLIETIAELAPFGAVAVISEMVGVVSSITEISKPELIFDFDFFAGHNEKVHIDLSWMDGIKPMINFMLISLLIVGLTMVMFNQTRLEAAG